jgi:hypothetical protein
MIARIVLLALALVAAVTLADWFSSPVRPCEAPIQQHSETKEANKSAEEYCSAGKIIAFWRAVGRLVDTWHDDLLAAATVVIAIFTVVLVSVSNRQAGLMESAIAAAHDANEISLKHMIADQRAWLTVGDLEVTQDIVFSAAQGGAVLFVSVKITNIGKTPALNAYTYMDIIFDYFSAPEAVAKMAQSARDTKANSTRVVLPGDFYKREWALDLPTPDKGTHIHPIVIGCTSYSIVPDGTLHQTGFVFGLFEKDQATGRFKFPLQVNVPRIPKETIGWDAATGGFAD